MPTKTPKPIVRAIRFEAGQLLLSDGTERNEAKQWQLLKAAYSKWDGPAELEIRPFVETRRDRANRYYWGVVIKLMAEESGYSKDDLHEWLKLQHNAKIVADLTTGEELRIGQSTAKLTVQQFSDYLEACMLTGAETLGISFPEPHLSEDWRDGKRGRAA